ncbi:MAG: protein kinase [Anaerolineales bacterium]
MSDIPLDLIERVEEGDYVLFVGPRASIAPGGHLGPPGESLLAMELVDRLGRQLEDYSYPWVAQHYADENGFDALHSYVGKRLGDVRYRPTKLHHLIVRLPFNVLVYTAQDVLMRSTYEKYNVPISEFALGIEGKVKIRRNTFIQLFGTVEQPPSLILTEDERRKTISGDTDLAADLRSISGNYILLFLGHTIDRSFREFYFQLRLLREDKGLPRAYLVWPEANQEDNRYWGKRHATVLPMDTQVFLDELVDNLIQRGNVPLIPDIEYEEPPLMSEEELSNRDNIFLRYGKRFGIGGSIESGGEFQPDDRSLALFQQVISEHNILKGPPDKLPEEEPKPEGIKREEFNAQIQLQRGNVEWAKGNHAQALEAFEEAIRRDPSLTDAYLSQYHLLVEINHLKEAEDVYQRLLEKAPNYAFLPSRYHIEKILGQVDLGISYRVKDLERDQLVTVTILRRTYTQQLDDLNNFVKAVSQIKSERISRLLESGRYRLHNYLVTEYLEGALLRDHMVLDEGLPFDEAMQIADEVAEALESGHHQGVPHLGLEPSNIILTEDGAKLVNYGFSRIAKSAIAKARQSTRSTRASVEYEAPEQRAGDPGDERSDVYALGTLLYEMLVGRPPGVGRFQLVSEPHPQADEAMDIVINHSRDIDPDRRFRTLTEMRREMQRITLTVRRGWIGQYIRMALSKLSILYAHLTTWQGGVVVLALLAIFLFTEFGNREYLRGLTRFAWLLLITSPATGALSNYVVRETARRQGLGSLISSGRGMGASLGCFFTVYLFRITDWGGVNLGESTLIPDFLGYSFLNFIIAIAMTLVVLWLIHLFGLATGKRFRRYPLGFYIGYALFCVLVILLALLRIPYGIIT